MPHYVRWGWNRMSKTVSAICIVLPLLLPGYSSGDSPDDATRLTVPGSGACEQVLNALAAAFNAQNPGVKVIVPRSTGTSGGIKAIRTGTHRLARAGRPLNNDELRTGLTFLPVADDAIVFAVGKNVGIDRLSAGQLADVFMGKITDWQQLGGQQSPIRVLIRQADETSMKNIRRHVTPFNDLVFCDQAKMAFHDYEMVDLLNKFPTSIGFLTMSSVAMPGNTMQPVGLDGVRPTADNLNSGDYPLKATYGMVYKKERLNALAGQFLAFIFSKNGNRVIRDIGLIPVPRSN